MIRIEPAKVQAASTLTDLAIRSEAYWGYDTTFMEKFKSLYEVTEGFISSNPMYVLTEEEDLIGFYGLLLNKEESSLEYLFIEPKHIGKGYGKILWNHMINECRKLGIEKFDIVTSPQAKEFYIKQGAVLCGEVSSLVTEGRKIPKLRYVVC